MKKAAKLYIKVVEMERPYESLPMDTNSCDGIWNICFNKVKFMSKMRKVAITTNYQKKHEAKNVKELILLVNSFVLH